MTRLVQLVQVMVAVLLGLGKTSSSIATYAYDAPVVARVHAREIDTIEARPTQFSDVQEGGLPRILKWIDAHLRLPRLHGA